MTGFAKKQCNANGHKYTIEIKTLNSKAMDTNAKVPARFHAHELEIRTLLNRLERGKVDFLLFEEDSTAAGCQLNHTLAAQHFQDIRQLADEQHLDPATGRPVSHSLLSVSVVSRKAWYADAMATAFMVMGLERSLQFIDDHSENPDIQAVFFIYDQDGEYHTFATPAFQQLIVK